MTNAARHAARDARAGPARAPTASSTIEVTRRRRRPRRSAARAGVGLDVDARAGRRARRHAARSTPARRRHARRAPGCPLRRAAVTEATPIRVADRRRPPASATGCARCSSAADDVEVVGEAANGAEAVAARATSCSPTSSLMDINMPGLNGIEATRRIVDARPHVGVLVLTMFEDDDSVFAAMRAGARGYLLKGAGAGRDRCARSARSAAARRSSARRRAPR